MSLDVVKRYDELYTDDAPMKAKTSHEQALLDLAREIRLEVLVPERKAVKPIELMVAELIARLRITHDEGCDLYEGERTGECDCSFVVRQQAADTIETLRSAALRTAPEGMVLREQMELIEMETRDGGQWTLRDVNEQAKMALLLSALPPEQTRAAQPADVPDGGTR